MKYFIALVAGYYVLEAVRHFIRQVGKWDSDEQELPFIYKFMLWLVILFTCLAWPLMLLRGKVCESK